MSEGINTVDMLYIELQKRILDAVYQPGEKLTENKLAEEFNVSRMPIRESLKRLEQDGLVTIQPQSGSYVRRYTMEEVKNALEIRTYLEALAIKLVIENNTDPYPMEKYITLMKETFEKPAFDKVTFGEYHYQFHHTLITLAGNALLTETYDKLRFRSLRQIFFEPMTQKEHMQIHDEHKKIIQLIREKSSRCEAFVIKHIWKRKRKTISEIISDTNF
jgi:DNA-binding GntR family transcriptional regulator